MLRGVIGDLVDKLKPIRQDTRFDDIKRIITLVDGSLLPALPKLVAAMWPHEKHKAFKLHTHFEFLRNVPTRMDVTPGGTGERQVLEGVLKSDRLYVMDAGYMGFSLFRKIIDIGSSFVCRAYDTLTVEVLESRLVSQEAKNANVLRDRVVRFTGDNACRVGLQQPMRLVEVKCTPHQRRGGRPGQGGPS